jgi:peroxisomal 2,4-dienoyl-CoA reductase
MTVQQIDLQGTYNTMKATLEEIKRTHGVYTHISATLHYTAIPWQSAASAAKAGVDALSQSIAVEMGPFGVRSNVIAPGMISGTEGADRLTPKGGESMVESRIPQQRVGHLDDIANMGVYLFSDAAAYISGAKFVVDGAAQHFPGPWLPYPMSSLDPQDLKELITGSKL